MFAAAEAQQVGLTTLARAAGVDRAMVYRWMRGHSPRIHELEACANVLGLRIGLVDQVDAVRAKLRRVLDAVMADAERRRHIAAQNYTVSLKWEAQGRANAARDISERMER